MAAAKKTATKDPLAGVKLFKITDGDGRSTHGGSLKWPMPQNDQPGDWVRVEGKLVQCSNGLHVTPKPIHWWQPGARVWEVEVESARDTITDSLNDTSQSKVCVRAARLIREANWGDFCVWLDGEHEINEGVALATDSATVTAYGSATVTAYGSATVTAYGSATVTAYGSATVTAYGSATVTATGSATVTAYGSATVTAYGSATVTATGSATVTAYGSATVTATGSATVISSIYHSDSATVALENMAAHVDRRSGKLKLRAAGVPK